MPAIKYRVTLTDDEVEMLEALLHRARERWPRVVGQEFRFLK